RTVGTRARARLGQVAGACRPTAHHARRHEPVRGAVVGHPVTALGDVASTDRFATYRRALLVLGAVRIEPVAEFRDIAHTGRRATLGAGGLLRVGRAVGTGPVAGLRRVAGASRWTAYRAAIAGRMLTRLAAAVAGVRGTGVVVVGAGCAARLHRIRGAGGT